MAITAAPYGAFLLNLGKAGFDFTVDTFAAALVTSTYTPNVATHATFTDITNETSGTGYIAGGQSLAGTSWTYDSVNNWCVFGASTVTWSNATFTARYCVIYKTTSGLLVGYIDFGVDQSPAAEDFNVSFSSGAARIKAG